jgi:hypothetical protein
VQVVTVALSLAGGSVTIITLVLALLIGCLRVSAGREDWREDRREG